MYKTTTVLCNNVSQTITSGTKVMKNGIPYIFEWAGRQNFERWRNLSKPQFFQAENWEGGMREVDAIVS